MKRPLRRVWMGLGFIGLLGFPASAEDTKHGLQSRFVFPGPAASTDDVIPWGRLRREDFRADGPPASLWLHSDRLNAVSCVFVGTDGEIPLDIEREQRQVGAIRYRVRVPRVRIVARFDRGCSWWNPATPTGRSAYTLEHEQIHFALTELAARRLQRLIDGRHELLEATATSAPRAQRRIQMQLEIALRGVSEELREEHARFDAETSARYDPPAQDRWRISVEARLADLAVVH